MSIKTISLIGLAALVLTACTTAQKEETKPEPKKNVSQESAPNEDDQFVKATEGFLNPSLYQVVVSSLDGNEPEALDLAKKRALNLFIAERGELFRPADRKFLKEIVDSKGKIVKTSKPINGKTYYLFHVAQQDLKIELKK